MPLAFVRGRSMTLGRQILLSLAVTVVSSIAVYGICLLIPKTYSSEAVLFFPSSQASLGSTAQQFFSGSGGQGGDLSSSGMPGSVSFPLIGSGPNTAAGILESRTCRAFVVKKLELDRRWRLTASRAEADLKKKASVRIDENGLLVITANVDDPELARDIVAAMFEHLSSESVELTLSFAKKNRKTLEDRLKVSEQKVEAARGALVTTAVSHPYVDASSMQQILADSLKKLGDARVAASAASAKLENYQAMIDKAIASGQSVGTLQAIGGGTLDRALELLAQDMKKHEAELELAKKTYTERSPEFKAAVKAVEADKTIVRKTAEAAKRDMKAQTFAPLIEARAELEALRRTESTYTDVFDEYKRMALKSPGDATLVKIKQSQFDTAVKTSEFLRFQLEQAIINEQRDPARFEVVDPATVNPDPVAPRKGLITGAWAAGCLAVCGWFVLRRRIKFVD